MELLFENIKASKRKNRTTYKKIVAHSSQSIDTHFQNSNAHDSLSNSANNNINHIKPFKETREFEEYDTTKNSLCSSNFDTDSEAFLFKDKAFEKPRFQHLKDIYSGGKDLDHFEAKLNAKKLKNKKYCLNRKIYPIEQQDKLQRTKKLPSTQIDYQFPNQFMTNVASVALNQRGAKFKDIFDPTKHNELSQDEGIIQFSQQSTKTSKTSGSQPKDDSDTAGSKEDCRVQLNFKETQRDSVNFLSAKQALRSAQHTKISVEQTDQKVHKIETATQVDDFTKNGSLPQASETGKIHKLSNFTQTPLDNIDDNVLESIQPMRQPDNYETADSIFTDERKRLSYKNAENFKTIDLPSNDSSSPDTDSTTNIAISQQNCSATIEDAGLHGQDTVSIKKSKEEIKTQETSGKDKGGVLIFCKESFFSEFDSSFDGRDHYEKQSVQPSNCNSEILLTASRPNVSEKSNGLSAYKTTLRTRMDIENKITLDSDVEADGNESFSIYEKAPTRVSKATILNIKARASKRNANLTKGNRKDAKCTTAVLFENLKCKNKKQIIQHQSELVKFKGLDEKRLEREKQSIQDLLELELRRHRSSEKLAKEDDKGIRLKEISNSHLSPYGSEGAPIEPVTELESNAEICSSKTFSNTLDTESDGRYPTDDEDDFRLNKKVKRYSRVIINSDSEFESPTSVTKKVEQGINHISENHIAPIDLGNFDNSIKYTKEMKGSQKVEITKTNDVHKCGAKEKSNMEITDYSKYLEAEAEESDDEWHGLGGDDFEESNESDSDIEGMIDDNLRLDVNPAEIRKILAAENREKDDKLINRILHDLNSGNFRKRGKSNLSLYFSDDEDEELKTYRVKRNDSIKRKLLDLGDESKLLKNPKSVAFFKSFIDDVIETKHPFAEVDHLKKFDTTAYIPSVFQPGSRQHLEKMVSPDFVQKSLSFLKNSRGSDESKEGTISCRTQDDENIDDFVNLKCQSFAALNQQSCNASFVSSKIKDSKFFAFDNNDFGTMNQSTSALRTFTSKRSTDDKSKDPVKKVKISNSYRAASGCKASVTYIGRKRKLIALNQGENN